jgi:hypothetical protein
MNGPEQAPFRAVTNGWPKPIGFWSSVSMGIGIMVGADIFALLGEASAIAGSAVYAPKSPEQG